jgi:hypothetical protein
LLQKNEARVASGMEFVKRGRSKIGDFGFWILDWPWVRGLSRADARDSDSSPLAANRTLGLGNPKSKI